ncbi:hypothetical protein L208DRAFT_1440801 [Tricholoma matsutake]|nr:hypothetical protein L208DRAFT_1440801 [Tricholoma matsutake 945]
MYIHPLICSRSFSTGSTIDFCDIKLRMPRLRVAICLPTKPISCPHLPGALEA